MPRPPSFLYMWYLSMICGKEFSLKYCYLLKLFYFGRQHSIFDISVSSFTVKSFQPHCSRLKSVCLYVIRFHCLLWTDSIPANAPRHDDLLPFSGLNYPLPSTHLRLAGPPLTGQCLSAMIGGGGLNCVSSSLLSSHRPLAAPSLRCRSATIPDAVAIASQCHHHCYQTCYHQPLLSLNLDPNQN